MKHKLLKSRMSRWHNTPTGAVNRALINLVVTYGERDVLDALKGLGIKNKQMRKVG